MESQPRNSSAQITSGPSRNHPFPSRRYVLLALTLTVLGAIAVGWCLSRTKPRRQPEGDAEPLGTLPAEFERQEAMLVAWPRQNDLSPQTPNPRFWNEEQILGDIVGAVWSCVPAVIVVEDAQSEQHVARVLSQKKIPTQRVHFIRAFFESEWIRDYGPMAVRGSDGVYTLIDAEYVDGPVAVYPHEDRMPSRLGELLGMRTVRAPITLHHGNLLGNGRGLCIVTERVLEENVGRGYDADDVRQVLAKYYGAEEVVFLENLVGEPTGHVDMFATFTAADTVVIGQYSSEYDSVNAAILDRNAQRLSSSALRGGPLKVARIPMPPRVPTPVGTELWPTYTNVAYANGILLVPVYLGWSPELETLAVKVYQRLLPDWIMVLVNSVPALRAGGGIHCMTSNLPALGRGLPSTTR